MLKITSLLFISLILSLSACINIEMGETEKGNGVIVEKSLDQDEFTGVKISGVFDVEIHPGTSHSLNMKGDENLLDLITVELKDEVLYIKAEKNFKSDKSVKLDIYAQEIASIHLGGATNVASSATLKGEELSLRIAGAGNVDLALEVSELEIDISGASSLDLSGNAADVDIDISGAADLEAEELKTHSMDLSMSGAGSAHVHADEDLSINLSGLGSVTYTGNPTNLTKNVSGLGSVKEG